MVTGVNMDDVINNLPESIRSLTEGKPYETNDFG